MKPLVTLPVAILAALTIVAAAVGIGGDSTVLVPPPESMAEQFAREIVGRRYDRALAYVEPSSGISLTTVRLFGERLREEGGGFEQVEGQPGAIRADRATADAVVTTRRLGDVRIRCVLVRRSGMWRIAAFATASAGMLPDDVRT